MTVERITKLSFAVIGKEGSTDDGNGFIQKLWTAANSHFPEIANIVIYAEDGTPAGIWGAMSDITRSFLPWQDNFSKGLYLAGAECVLSAVPPEGWTKWIIPSYEYVRIDNNGPDAFSAGFEYLKENGLALAGAIHEFTHVSTGRNYLYFPIKNLTTDKKNYKR